MGKKKHLAIAAYRCEVAGIPHDDFIDIQVKYFEFENESRIEVALIAEPSHSYLNANGEKVEWLFSDLLILHNYDNPEHGKELCGCHIGAAEVTKLSSPPISIENKKRTLAINTESEWLLSLTPETKARFLASLSFNLTIAGRDSYQPKTMELKHPEQLRYINEIQHRISQTLLRVLDGDSYEDFEKTIAESLIGEDNINQRGLNSWAWHQAKVQIQTKEEPEV
jgi:hypothetical protein